MDRSVVTPEHALWRYAEPFRHEAVSALIRAHSTNQTDIRDAVLAGRDLGDVREVLDLGCGFGFMAEKVAARVHPDARITGVDACRSNRRHFEARVTAAGREPAFVWARIGDRLPWKDASYELVVASHSLYYFPDLVPEIARVLVSEGHFLAVTHGERGAREICEVSGFPPERSPLMRVVQRFSAENGEQLLARSFERVTRIDYPNALEFQLDQSEDLLAYLRFKMRLLTDWPESEPELARLESRSWLQQTFGPGKVVVDKSDAGFWCGGPRWGPGSPGYEEWLTRYEIPDGFWSL